MSRQKNLPPTLIYVSKFLMPVISFIPSPVRSIYTTISHPSPIGLQMNQGPLNVESRKKEHLNHGNEREGIEESGDSIGKGMMMMMISKSRDM